MKPPKSPDISSTRTYRLTGVSPQSKKAIDRLYTWNSKKKEKLAKMKSEAKHENSFTPQINDISKMILEEPDEAPSLAQKLQSQARTRNSRGGVAYSKTADHENCTFTPRINKRSV